VGEDGGEEERVLGGEEGASLKGGKREWVRRGERGEERTE